MVRGWNRTCPTCGSTDGERVNNIAIPPRFRCDVCGYVWDNSGIRPVFIVPARDLAAVTGDQLDAFVERVVDQTGASG